MEDRKKIVEYLCSLTEKQKNRIKVIYGHQVFYGIHQYFDRPPRYITFLRNPVDRIFSLYNAYRRRTEKGLRIVKWMEPAFRDSEIPPSFEEWLSPKLRSMTTEICAGFLRIKKNSQRNLPSLLIQAKMILEKFYFVGITEQFDDEAPYLYHEIGIRRFFKNRNVTQKNYASRNNRALREKTALFCQGDEELYKHALILSRAFKKQKAHYGPISNFMKSKMWLGKKFPFNSPERTFKVADAKETQRCSEETPSPSLPPRILISGQPKSGTTVLFYQIKNSISPQARCLYEVKQYEPKHEDADVPVLSKILIQKNLEIDFDSFKTFGKRILIVRDPRDRFVSGMLYSTLRLFREDRQKFYQFLEWLKKKQADPKSISVKSLHQLSRKSDASNGKMRAGSLRVFMRHHRQYSDYFVLKYEDFIDRKVDLLERYLGFKLSGKFGEDETLKRVARTKSYGHWRDWFLEEDVDFFRSHFQPYMKQYGYDDDWQIRDKPVILPSHSSDYVQRLVKNFEVKQGAVR